MLIFLIVIVVLLLFGSMLGNALGLGVILWQSKAGRFVLGCLAAGLFWMVIQFNSLPSTPSAAATASDQTPYQPDAETAAVMAEAEASPLHQKALLYAGSAYDAERAAACAHFREHPDVIAARPDVQGSDAGIELTVRPGMTDADLLPLARRVRRYLSANFQGDRALIIQEVNIHHPGEENAEMTSLAEHAGLDNTEGMVGAIVENGVEETDTQLDPTYHIAQDGKIIE